MTNDLPEHVLIGPYRYEVRIEEAPFIDDKNQSVLCGEVDHNAGLIRVLRCAPDHMFVTLWHEILHGIDDIAGTELSEETIERLAPILAGVLLDNGYVKRGPA